MGIMVRMSKMSIAEEEQMAYAHIRRRDMPRAKSCPSCGHAEDPGAREAWLRRSAPPTFERKPRLWWELRDLGQGRMAVVRCRHCPHRHAVISIWG